MHLLFNSLLTFYSFNVNQIYDDFLRELFKEVIPERYTGDQSENVQYLRLKPDDEYITPRKVLSKMFQSYATDELPEEGGTTRIFGFEEEIDMIYKG